MIDQIAHSIDSFHRRAFVVTSIARRDSMRFCNRHNFTFRRALSAEACSLGQVICHARTKWVCLARLPCFASFSRTRADGWWLRESSRRDGRGKKRSKAARKTERPQRQDARRTRWENFRRICISALSLVCFPSLKFRRFPRNGRHSLSLSLSLSLCLSRSFLWSLWEQLIAHIFHFLGNPGRHLFARLFHSLLFRELHRSSSSVYKLCFLAPSLPLRCCVSTSYLCEYNFRISTCNDYHASGGVTCIMPLNDSNILQLYDIHFSKFLFKYASRVKRF